jgi:hypothetical protein
VVGLAITLIRQKNRSGKKCDWFGDDADSTKRSGKRCEWFGDYVDSKKKRISLGDLMLGRCTDLKKKTNTTWRFDARPMRRFEEKTEHRWGFDARPVCIF